MEDYWNAAGWPIAPTHILRSWCLNTLRGIYICFRVVHRVLMHQPINIIYDVSRFLYVNYFRHFIRYVQAKHVGKMIQKFQLSRVKKVVAPKSCTYCVISMLFIRDDSKVLLLQLFIYNYTLYLSNPFRLTLIIRPDCEREWNLSNL